MLLHIVRVCTIRLTPGMASRISLRNRQAFDDCEDVEKITGMVLRGYHPRSSWLGGAAGLACNVLGITNGPKNRQRVKGPGVPGGDAGAGATGGCAAGLPAAGLPAGLFPVLASLRSGLDISVPGTKVWR